MDAPIPRHGSTPMEVPVTLEISGELSGLAPDAAGTVATIHAGGRVFDATVASGRYAATISGLRNADMVSVEVQSTRARYRSTIGSFGKLKRHSGGDRKVVQAELDSLRASPWSTAVDWMVRRTLDGSVATSDREFERATRAIDGDDTMMAAYVLAAAASGEIPTPRHSDGLALLEDEAAYSAVVAEAGRDRRARAWLFEQAHRAELKSLVDLPSRLALLGAVPHEDVPVFVADGVKVLIRNTDGSFDFHESQPRAHPVYDAILSSGDVVLTPRESRVEETYVNHPSLGWTQVFRSLEYVTLRRLTAGALHALWASRETWREHYPVYPHVPPTLVDGARVWSGSDLAAIARPIRWPTEPRSRAMPWMCVQIDRFDRDHPELDDCGYARHAFSSAGIGFAQELGYLVDDDLSPMVPAAGPYFDWTLGEDGRRLQLSHGDTSTDFWSIDETVDGLETLLYLARTQDPRVPGQTLAGVTVATRTGPTQLNADWAVGTWASGSAIAVPTQYPDPRGTLFIERNADGSGEQRNTGHGLPDEVRPQRSDLMADRVYDTQWLARYQDGHGEWTGDCAGAFASDAVSCDAMRTRYFKPLLHVGDRLYGIEEIYFSSRVNNGQPPYMAMRSNSRPNFLVCSSGACTEYLPGGGTAAAPRTTASTSPYSSPARKPALSWSGSGWLPGGVLEKSDHFRVSTGRFQRASSKPVLPARDRPLRETLPETTPVTTANRHFATAVAASRSDTRAIDRPAMSTPDGVDRPAFAHSVWSAVGQHADPVRIYGALVMR